MKTRIYLIAAILLVVVHNIVRADVTNVTGYGTISWKGALYTDNLSKTWNIDTRQNSKSTKIVYTIDTEASYDLVIIKQSSDNYNWSTMIGLSGFTNGTIFTYSSSRYIQITFTSNGTNSYPLGYQGIEIVYSADNALVTNSDLQIGGNAYVAGKTGIGTSSPQTKLHVVESTLLSSTATSATPAISRAEGNPGNGNKYCMNSYLLRESAGSDWTSASFLTGIDIDNYFVSQLGVKSGLKSWIKQIPYSEKIDFGSSGNTFMSVGSKVGIGTSSPDAKLHINNGDNSDAAILATTSAAGGIPSQCSKLLISSLSESTISAPIFRIGHQFWGNNNNGYITFYRGGDQSGGFLQFGTNGLDRLRIDGNGNIGIGTTNPQNTLDVKGTIRATEVKVESVDKFADFVFDKDYKLRDLKEVNSYIEDNGHLPEIPSAKEVKENGMSLVDMQVKLLQKVEEMTLYIIQLQNRISELEKAKK